MRKRFVIGAVAGFLSIFAVISMSACDDVEAETTEVEASAIKVTVANPAVGYIEEVTAFTGKVMPDDSVSVYGKSSGTVLKTYFEIGDTVKKGQLLFELDPKDYQIALEQSKLAYDMTMQNIDVAEHGSGDALTELQYETQLTQAENYYKQMRDVVEAMAEDDFDFSEFRKTRKKLKEAEEEWEKDASEETWSAYNAILREYDEFIDEYTERASILTYITQFENAYDSYMQAVESYEIYKTTQKAENAETYEMTRQQAKLQYDSMLQTMDNLKVYSPINGVIEYKNVTDNGAYVPSVAGYVVSNKEIMVVSFAVSADTADEMELGDIVIVENGQRKYEAEITEIGSMAEEQSGLFTVKARLFEQAKLRSGVSVKLTAVTAKSDDTLIVSASSVYYDDGNAFVYVEKDGIVVVSPVMVGIISNDNAEILDEIDTYANIITSWNPNLTDGASVEVSEEV